MAVFLKRKVRVSRQLLWRRAFAARPVAGDLLVFFLIFFFRAIFLFFVRDQIWNFKILIFWYFCMICTRCEYNKLLYFYSLLFISLSSVRSTIFIFLHFLLCYLSTKLTKAIVCKAIPEIRVQESIISFIIKIPSKLGYFLVLICYD